MIARKQSLTHKHAATSRERASASTNRSPGPLPAHPRSPWPWRAMRTAFQSSVRVSASSRRRGGSVMAAASRANGRTVLVAGAAGKTGKLAAKRIAASNELELRALVRTQQVRTARTRPCASAARSARQQASNGLPATPAPLAPLMLAFETRTSRAQSFSRVLLRGSALGGLAPLAQCGPVLRLSLRCVLHGRTLCLHLASASPSLLPFSAPHPCTSLVPLLRLFSPSSVPPLLCTWSVPFLAGTSPAPVPMLEQASRLAGAHRHGNA